LQACDFGALFFVQPQGRGLHGVRLAVYRKPKVDRQTLLTISFTASIAFFNQENPMTQNQFAALCAQYGIAPSLALENPDIVAALRARDSAAVERILADDF